MSTTQRKRRSLLALCAGMVAAVALAAVQQVPQETCIISVPEGDRNPSSSAVSDGVLIDARYLTEGVSDGWDLITTPYVPGFLLIYK